MKKANIEVNTTSADKLKATASRHRNALAKQLRRGKNRRLGPIETLSLKMSGSTDGRAGIPKQADSGEWTSSFIVKESSSYAEYCDRVWGNQQIELHWAHARCDELYDEIIKLKEKLDEVKRTAMPEARSSALIRKRGEEHLSDSQVQARRNREEAKENARYRAAVAQVEEQLDDRLKELSLLHSFITESDNAARLICERVKNHTLQRIDVYWRAAYRVHPDALKMPVALSLALGSEAENTYMSNHSLKDASISELLAQYENGSNIGEIKEAA